MKAKPAENENNPEAQRYVEVIEPRTVRVERLLPGPIERVWAYITESEKRGKWFASGPMELRPGGKLELHFRHIDLSADKVQAPESYRKYDHGETSYGRVTRCEPPKLIAFQWGEESGDESEATFELSEQEGQVLLVVTHRRLHDRKAMVGVAGGWHTHLGILVDILNGREPKPFWPTFKQLEAEYDKRLPQDV